MWAYVETLLVFVVHSPDCIYVHGLICLPRISEIFFGFCIPNLIRWCFVFVETIPLSVKVKYFSVVNTDPGSEAFLTPGSGIRDG
jgi:hypothetical protein